MPRRAGRPSIKESAQPDRDELFSEAYLTAPHAPKAVGARGQVPEYRIIHAETLGIAGKPQQHFLIRAPFAAWVRAGGQGRVLEEAEDLFVAEFVGLFGLH